MSQYFSRERSRKVLPDLIMTRNTAEHAIPINAAEIKQFCLPMFLTQGVILEVKTEISVSGQAEKEAAYP